VAVECYNQLMKRFISQQLKAWKHKKRRKPLILQGARQVGKTTILERFGEAEFSHCVSINFENDERARMIFDQDLHPERIIEALNLRLERKIVAKDTLLIFDEIQECPNALNSLKYFCEQAPEYYICAAGSLLGVKLAQGKGFPVGKVNFLSLLPMSFFEFLIALGKENLAEYLQNLQLNDQINEAIHLDLCDLLKQYLYIGGMPEAVKTFRDERDYFSVREVQQEIIKSYLLDFAKHAPENQIMKITQVWENLPAQLAKENKKFVFSVLRQGARAREFEIAIQWLIDAGLIYPAYQVDTPKLPLKAYAKLNTFKLYMLDVGILGAMSGLEAEIILEKNLLFQEFKGSLTENLAAQLLKVSGLGQLHYWSSGNTAEVDFILPHKREIIPLEIKSGISTKKKSLQIYKERYQPTQAYRASIMNLKTQENLVNIPLYLIEKFLADGDDCLEN